MITGSHINDETNQLDSQGRVLVNIGHPAEEKDIFLLPQIARTIKPHQVIIYLIYQMFIYYLYIIQYYTRFNILLYFHKKLIEI